MKTIVIHIPDPLKAKLDVLRTQGYTINGYVCAMLGRALADSPTATRSRKGRMVVQYRKPGGRWQRRTVPARRLEATILKLEDEGAEIVTPNDHGTSN